MKMVLTSLSAVSSRPRRYMKVVLTSQSSVSSGPRRYMKVVLTSQSSVSSGPRSYIKVVLTSLSAVSSEPRRYMKVVLTSLSAVSSGPKHDTKIVLTSQSAGLAPNRILQNKEKRLSCHEPVGQLCGVRLHENEFYATKSQAILILVFIHVLYASYRQFASQISCFGRHYHQSIDLQLSVRVAPIQIQAYCTF